MELFTLGVGNYSEEDVRVGARLDGLARRPAYGYRRIHVRCARARLGGSKSFLGRTGNFTATISSASSSHQPGARDSLRPACSTCSCTTTRAQLVDALRCALCAHDFELAPILSGRSWPATSSTAARLPRAGEESGRVRCRNVQALGLRQSIDVTLAALTQMGQRLFFPPNVAGWPGGAKNWLTSGTMIARQNFLAAGQLADAATVLAARAADVSSATRSAARARFCKATRRDGAHELDRLSERERARRARAAFGGKLRRTRARCRLSRDGDAGVPVELIT
jgi:hypothetical protein